jgi:hypothetical protein
MANLEPPLILPPDGAREWRRMGDALLDAPRAGVPIDDPFTITRRWPARSPRTSRTISIQR